jgi:hypothetical protein
LVLFFKKEHLPFLVTYLTVGLVTRMGRNPPAQSSAKRLSSHPQEPRLPTARVELGQRKPADSSFSEEKE